MTPRTISDIIGQPYVTRRLQQLASKPRECCLLAEGSPGVGKTASAHCLAYDLGCDDAMSGLFFMPAIKLTMQVAVELMEYTLYHRPMQGRGWKVLIIDELERLPSPQVAVYLKTALDEYSMPPKTIVVATSNGAGSLDPALLQRFEILAYSSGPLFQADCLDCLGEDYQKRTGCEPPSGWRLWGGLRGEFSMRLAARAMEQAISDLELCAA